ncbi:LysR family transcriptional regulator [Thaumasiovibrio sp. DFM-14]|uniref:LysR family transcriptional regulator n=1 Tax=Thaumasiovibrio sp. DFM-14 TaxID=3384792 RepID=UPI00399FC31B
MLRTFSILFQELNTRKAAERLYVSQPAISQSLQKLRAQIDDELFVKVPSGLKPTPFAIELAKDIAPYLDGLSNVLNKDRTFDPLALNSTLRIAVAPAVLVCLSGSLYNHFSKVAPHATLELLSWTESSMSRLQNDEITLGVTLKQKPVQGVHIEQVAELEAKVIVNRQHPIQTETVTPKDMEPYPIASVITPGYNDHFIEAALLMEEQGLSPKIGFRSELVMALVDVVEQTDFFMPHSDLFPIHRFPSLKSITPLIKGVPYKNHIYAYFHIKYRDTELIKWLVGEVQHVIEQEKSK